MGIRWGALAAEEIRRREIFGDINRAQKVYAHTRLWRQTLLASLNSDLLTSSNLLASCVAGRFAIPVPSPIYGSYTLEKMAAPFQCSHPPTDCLQRFC
jgi:hypothetical protein